MKVAIAADHAGYQLKNALRDHLRARGHEVQDLGTDSDASTDYPDYAAKVASEVAAGKAERGILVCSTGVGMAITANKVPGIRAALAVNEDEVRLTRSHNDANVLTLGAKFTDPDAATRYADLFLDTGFEGGRHARRLEKIRALEHSEPQSAASEVTHS